MTTIESAKREFPAVETVGQADLRDTHRSLQIVPSSRPELAFSLLLPKGWQEDPASVAPAGDGSDWTPLAVFAKRPDNPAELSLTDWSMVSVLWKRLTVEVRLDEWIAFQMAALDVEIESIRLWVDAAGPVIDVGGTTTGTVDATTRNARRVPTVVRVLARADGKDAFLVWGMATQEMYPSAARDFLIAGASFRLSRQSQGPREAIQSAIVTAEPRFQVAHPASWTAQPLSAPPGVVGKSALNLHLVEEERMKGFIRVKAVDMRIVRGASRESLLRDATDELAQTSITLQRQWSELNDPIIAGIDGLLQAHESACVVQGANFEVHFAVVRRDTILFCITALVLPMQLDAPTCMRGHRAYAIALDSVAPLA